MVESSSVAIDDEYPLSAMQQGMLFHGLHSDASGVDVEQVVCTLAERLRVPDMLAAWDTVVSRYDILRTRFDWESRPEPVQVVCRSVALPTRVMDWRTLAHSEQQEQLAALLVEDRAAGFDLRRAPLMRLTLIRCGDSAYELVWTFHHAILDGRSFPILLKEVFGLYEATAGGRTPRLPAPRQYRTYIDWLQLRNPDASKSFWRSRLAGFTAPTPLASSLPRGSASGRGIAELRLSGAEQDHLARFAHAAQCSLSTLVNGAWSLLLSRYTGSEDVLFGTTMACRRSAVEGAHEMVGLFINTLPFRTSVAPDAIVFDWLLGLRSEQIALREHEQTPLVRIQSWSDVPPGTSLFETLVVFENYLLDSALRRQGGSWEQRRFTYHGQTNYPVTLVCYSDTEMLLHLAYDRASLDDAIAERMLAHLKRLLQALAQDGRRRLADIEMLSVEEREALLPIPVHPSGIPTFCVHERFERCAAATPDAQALTCDGQTLTYAQLNERANQLAHRLRVLGVVPDTLVGVHLERSAELVIALLGILKAGGAYLPLDPAYPKDRIRFMLDDAKVPIVVSAQSLVDGLPHSNAHLLAIEDTADEPRENLPSSSGVDNLAYVIYTSGSTGNPKGVLITHANVSRLFTATDEWFQFGPQDVWTLFHSYAFDFSVWEIWGALLYGGRLVVVPYFVSREPDAFLDLLVRERVTVLNQTPSAFRQLMNADAVRAHQPALAVRCVVLGGEALDVSSLRAWFDRRGDDAPQIINMFGITETTVHVTYRRITRADVERGAGSVVGVAIPDLSVCVLDPHQQLVPVGVTGEIYVGGAGVARGYLNRPDLTRTRFVSDPVSLAGPPLYRSGDLGRWLPNGELEYRGRIDDQVKIRGFRIEPGEIQTVVRNAPGVRDVTVIAQQSATAETRLVAYIVLDPAASVDAVRRTAQAELPDYMIPAFVAIDAIPMTSNGKVDRDALPALSAQPRVGRYIAPRNETERTLASVWTSVLRQDRISVDDNFFELGGDSIIGIQVIARCRQAGLHLTTRDVFKHPTIAGLAELVTPAAGPTLVETAPAGDAPLTPIASWFFDLDLAQPNHWNQAFMLEVPRDLNLDWLEDALKVVVDRHDAFRLRFRRAGKSWQSTFAPVPPAVPVERIDLSYVPSENVATSIASAAANAQASLDITDGPALRVVSIREAADAPARLLIAMHHALVDAVSWRVLLEDIEAAYVAIRANREPRLDEPTTPFKGWAEQLVSYAGNRAKHGFSAWAQPIDRDDVSLPCDRYSDLNLNTEGSSDTLTVSFSAAETDRLLRQAPAAYGTHVNDLLLAALSQVLLSWTGRDSIVIDLEGHGREDALDSIDVSRTIGWFTSLFPVRLSQPDASPSGLITHTKETLRQLHDRGLSFGALRYLSPDPAVRRSLAELPDRQLLFNYLGQTDAITAGSSLFRLTGEPSGPWRGAANRRTHLVDVLASVRDGQLHVQWTYSDRFHDSVSIARIADGYAAALRGLIDHCVHAPTATVTPSDYPLADLLQPELDELTRRFPAFADVYPLAPMQQLFYSMEGLQSAPGFEQWEFALEGPLDVPRLRWAWEQVVSRHPILRTAFAQLGSARPYQIVLPQADLSWHDDDWRATSSDEQERRLQEFLAADLTRQFNLERPPLMRVALFCMGDRSHRLVWSTHHLLIDGWSWPLIFSELSSLYSDGRASALPKPCGYRDYIAWLQHHDDVPDETFWRRMLAGISEPTPIPTLPAPAHGGDSTDVRRVLSAEVSHALRTMARTQRVTLGTVVNAAWSLVLAHHSGQSDIMFGASVAGRPDDVSGIETMVGPCVNNIPIRVLVDGSATVRDWLQQLHVHIGDLTAHQTTPLMTIHACSAVPAWRRLFDTLVVFQNYIVDDNAQALGDTRLSLRRCPEATTYPVTVVVTPGEQIEIKVLPSSDRFTAASAAAVCDDLVSLLERMTDPVDARVASLLAILPSETRGNSGRASEERRDRRARLTAPRTEMEHALVAIWRDLFEGEVGTDENYFELGIHSLMLIRAHERISATLRSGLPIVALFQYPTIRDLAAHMTATAAPVRREDDIRARARKQRMVIARRQAAAKTNRPQ